MTKHIPRPLNTLLIVSLYAVFLLSNLYHHRNNSAVDLASSYFGCRILAADHSEHLYSHSNTHFNEINDPRWNEIAQIERYEYDLPPYVQTPLWAYALQPVCQELGFINFDRLFLGIELLCSALIVWLITTLWAPQFANPAWLASTLTLLSLSIPFRYTLFLNQTHPIFIALMLGSIYLIKKRHISLGSLALALAATVKLTPGLLAIYWLGSKRYKAFAGFSLWSLGLLLLALITTGSNLFFEYLSTIGRISDVLLVSFNNQSLAVWLADLSGNHTNIRNWAIHPLPFSSKLLASGTLISIMAFLIFRYHQLQTCLTANKQRFEAIAVSALMVTMTLFPSIAWSHYYIVLIVPMMVLGQIAYSDQRPLLIIPLIAIFALNVSPLAFNDLRPDFTDASILRSHFFSGILTLMVLFNEIRLIKRSTSNARGS